MDQSLPPSLAAEFAELKRRVADLERTPRLTNANVTGRIRLIDEAGKVVGWFGAAADGTQVVAMGPDLLASTTAVGLWWDETNGLLAPYEHVPWVRTDESRAITSGTFTAAHQVLVELTQSKNVRIACPIVVPAGTTGEIRYTVSGQGSTSVYPLSDGFSGTVKVDWLAPVSLYSGPYFVMQEVRRVSGTGSIAVFSPYPLTFGSFPSATTDGTWSLL